ncbi:MAG: hypothetical protein EBS77_06350 [Gammaproteobacteria bacterium]|nr:hypothetical protein [Gammaproteobacteria bacterium]
MDVVLLLVAFAATLGLLVYSQRLVKRIKEMEALNQKTGVLMKKTGATIPQTPVAAASGQGPSAEATFLAFSQQTMEPAQADRHEVIVTKHLAQILRQGASDAERGETQVPAQATKVATLRGVVESWLPAPVVAEIYALGQESIGSSAQLIQARARLMTKCVALWQGWGRKFTPTLLDTVAIPLPDQATLMAPAEESPSGLSAPEDQSAQSPVSETPR